MSTLISSESAKWTCTVLVGVVTRYFSWNDCFMGYFFFFGCGVIAINGFFMCAQTSKIKKEENKGLGKI